MANFTKTISFSVNVFGPGGSTLWGSVQPMTWGASKWGEGTQRTQFSVGKFISDSITISDAFTHSQNVLVSLSLSLSDALITESVGSGNGYLYVFVRPSTNAEDRSDPTYSAVNAGSTTYTSLSVAVTTWS